MLSSSMLTVASGQTAELSITKSAKGKGCITTSNEYSCVQSLSSPTISFIVYVLSSVLDVLFKTKDSLTKLRAVSYTHLTLPTKA